MKQFALAQNLLEMAAKKTCPTCGHGMAGFHYWYKGAWKCKSSSLANPNVAAATAATQSSPAAPTAAPISAPVAAPVVAPKPTAAAPTVDLTTPIGGVEPVDHTQIKWFLNTKYIMNYTIEDDGTVNVDGDVTLTGCGIGLQECPVKFGVVKGNFTTNDVNFKTFKNFPTEVGGNLLIKMSLTVPDYTGFPAVIKGVASMKTIKAGSLKGFPQRIEKFAEITVDGAKHDLNDLGDFGGGIYLNVEGGPLSNLSGLPRKVNGDLQIKARGVSSLEGFPEEVNGSVTIVMNDRDGGATPTKSMNKHIKRINGILYLLVDSLMVLKDKADIPPLLSALLIKGMTEVRFADSTYGQSTMKPIVRNLENEMNKCIADQMDIHEFQDYLIDAGWVKAARM